MRWWVDKRTTLKSIRKYCLDCEGRNPVWVKECLDPVCSLYPYRMGKDPARAGTGGKRRVK